VGFSRERKPSVTLDHRSLPPRSSTPDRLANPGRHQARLTSTFEVRGNELKIIPGGDRHAASLAAAQRPLPSESPQPGMGASDSSASPSVSPQPGSTAPPRLPSSADPPVPTLSTASTGSMQGASIQSPTNVEIAVHMPGAVNRPPSSASSA
jgi:hypothetical protein